jgi:hypothetical protein
LKEDDIGEAYRIGGRLEIARNLHLLRRRKRPLEKLTVHGKIKLESIVGKWGENVSTGDTWFMIGASDLLF